MKHNFKFDISIIIVNYNTYGFLVTCVDSILRSINGLNIEIILIDNSEIKRRQSLSHYKKKFKNTTIIKSNKNNGYAAGVNKGIKISKGKYIAVINPDVTLINKCLKKLYKYSEKKNRIGIIGPKEFALNGKIQPSCRSFPGKLTLFYKRIFLIRSIPFFKKKINKYFMLDYNHQYPRKVDWVQGSFMFIRKSCVDKVGLMDERFFMYLEDVDLCRRFWENRYEVWYYPKAQAIHIGQHHSIQFGFLGIFTKISWIHLISYIKYSIKYWRLKRKPSKDDCI